MSQVASDSLLWIKNELDHTLVRARQALETYVEKAEDKEALTQCLELLHQVQGTLRIVEVYGAAMLAEEMESVVRGFETGEVARNDAAFEVLMRAMLQLPDYLERVIGGRRDMPLALLSLLNDLRTVRGQPLLSESALFAYNLAGRSTATMTPQAAPAKAVDIKGLAAKVRPKFQAALLGWYKGDDAAKHLAVLADAAEKLEQAATTPPVFELWWIVGGIIEGLQEGGIQADVSLKQLLGQVDRQMKKLMEQGEGQAADDPAQDLVNNLLYYIGRADTAGKRILAIKESFKLGELLPQESEVQEARDSLSGPNVNLMRTVSGAIREDIGRIKDTLDIFVRMGKSDTSELAPLDELIKKVGDTLTVLGLPALNQELDAQRNNLRQMLSTKQAPDEAALMDIASGIVRVESGLDEAMSDLVTPDGSGKSGSPSAASAQAEMRDVQAAVIRESIINMARVKEAIVEFVNDPSRRDGLKPLPGHIREIQASFRFLEMPRVVNLLGSLRQYIMRKLLATKGAPANNELDRMADAIVSMEFYLETVQQGRGNPLSMLDNAEACVAALGFPADQEYPDDQDVDMTGVDSEPGETIVMDSDALVEEISLETPPDEPTQIKEVPTIMVSEQDAPKVMAARPKPAAPKPAPVPMQAAVAQDVDPEIVEIFLEEAQEEMNSLRETFPRWRSNPADREALTTLRRSFHTLKGSGRMVGARLIGEFAWAYENMLNRVMDQTVTPNEDMYALIDMGIAALPELVEQLEVGSAPKVDVQPMMDAAAAMSRGEQPPLPGTAAAEPPPPEEPTMIRPAGMGLPGIEEPTVIMPRVEILPPAVAMDPVLYDIFKREAEGHLMALDTFRNQILTDRSIGEDTVRALHTLHGSAALAGASNMAMLIKPLHRYVASLREQDQMLPSEHVGLVKDVLVCMRTMLGALGNGEVIPPPKGLIGRLKHLRPEGTNTLTGIETGELAGEEIIMSGPAEVEAEEPPAMPTKPKKKGKAEAPAKAQPAKFVQLSDLKDFDADLAAIFFEEASELLESSDNSLHHWSQNKTDSEMVAQLQRNLHTLKGGARMAGLTPMGDLSHEMETVLTDVVDGRITASNEMFILLNRSVDRLHRMMEQAYANQPIYDAGDLVLDLKRVHGHTVDQELEPEVSEEKFESVTIKAPPPIIDHTDTGSATGTGTGTGTSTGTPAPVILPEPEADEEAAAEAALGGDSKRRTGSRIQYELVRVRADLLESALNYAGEVGIYRSRLEQQVNTINFNLGELEQTVVRLRDQLRKLEIENEAQIRSQYVQEAGVENPDFDPLELDQFSTLQQLSRALAESVGDLVSIQALLTNQAREAETLLLQQSRVTTELQDGLMRTRMVPFSRHAQRLRRVVRQTADDEHKQVDLKFIGAEGEMDRQVLERVLAPLEHMLRNSVVHGIEDAKRRKQNKKPDAGNISIALHREGSEVVMEVMDDGGGLNIKAIRKKAEELGMTAKDARLSERDIMQFILEPGFSTAEKVTQSAGRGVGMDVVASEIKQLGGSLRMDSTEGQGAKFTVRLPFTLSITQGLLVKVADQPYAVPLPSIEAIARIPRMQLEQIMSTENPVYTYGGRQYRLQHLSVLLGIGAPQFPEELTTVPLLLVRSGDNSIALITEGMQGSREVVVKSVGPQVSSIRGISGATILGDGSILLILDVSALARSVALPEAEQIIVEEREVPQEDRRILAMVVDDSITVRRVTQRLLERYNMRVITAKDGVDALATLQENIPDVMLLDIEMPRMDGYELAQHMRNDERFKGIPIIMITSRTGEKHRNRAMEIGVDRYLGKPYQEAELLENIQELVGSFNPQRTSW